MQKKVHQQTRVVGKIMDKVHPQISYYHRHITWHECRALRFGSRPVDPPNHQSNSLPKFLAIATACDIILCLATRVQHTTSGNESAYHYCITL